MWKEKLRDMVLTLHQRVEFFWNLGELSLLNSKHHTFTVSQMQYIPVVVQSLSRVQLFATLWTAVCKASLFPTISQDLLKFLSIELVMLSIYLSHPLLPLSPFAFLKGNQMMDIIYRHFKDVPWLPWWLRWKSSRWLTHVLGKLSCSWGSPPHSSFYNCLAFLTVWWLGSKKTRHFCDLVSEVVVTSVMFIGRDNHKVLRIGAMNSTSCWDHFWKF